VPVEPVAIRPDRPVPAWQFRTWELLAPRLPRAVLRWIGRFFLRLPPGSRPRRWFALTFSQIAWDVTARTRFDLVLPIWDPDCEWHWDATFQGLGFDEVYRGHAGVRRSLIQWNEIWSHRSFTVREVLDGGSTWVLRTAVAGRGAVSGVPIEGEVNSVVRLDPFIVDFRNFADHAEALREAGFAPSPASRDQA
jgi:hypothetical protein